MITFKILKVKDIPAVLYKKLYGLNFRENGSMQDTLKTTRYFSLDTDYVFIEVDNDFVIGWALISLFLDSNEYEFQIYVRRTHRRQGIGLKIVEQVSNFLIKNKRNYYGLMQT